jgi:hypothetical protein
VSGELTIKLEATLEVLYGQCGCPPGLGTPSSGPTFALALQAANMSSKGGVPTNMGQVFTDDNAFVALPLQEDWQSKVVGLFPVNDPTPAYTVRLTYEDTTTATLPLKGLLLLEASPDNLITEVAVKGSVTLGWLVLGQVP